MINNYVKLKEKKRIDKTIYKEEQVTAPDFIDDYGRLINCGYVVFDFDAQPYIDIISKIIEKSTLKCKRLTRFPYVCNECHKRLRCQLEKYEYVPITAQRTVFYWFYYCSIIL